MRRNFLFSFRIFSFVRGMIFLLFSVCIFSLCCQLFAGNEKEIFSFRIIQTTDIHGSYSSYTKEAIPSLAAVIRKAEKEKGRENTLYIDCGDLFQGTFEASSDKGKMMIHILNQLSCDVFIPGNHDLDFGVKNFLEQISRFQGKVLACNLRAEKDPFRIFSYAFFRRGGANIAVIGMSPRFLKSWFTRKNLLGLTEKNVMKQFHSIMPKIMAAKPHFIIFAMHEGEYKNTLKEGIKEKGFLSRLFRKWPQIDLVLGGHTHLISPGKKCYQGQWYVQAPPLAAGAAVIDVKIHAGTRKILSLHSEIRSTEKIPPDPEIEKAIAPLLKKTGKEGREKLGYLPFSPSPAGRSLKRAAKNPFAALMGKALREAANTKIAFHGTMGNYKCRAGVITRRRLFLLLPYENNISCIPVTREECRTILEEQIRNIRFNNFQAPSGIKYTYRKGKVLSLSLEDDSFWPENGLQCAFSSYVLSGAGNRFPRLAEIAERKRALQKDLPVSVRKAAEEYILKYLQISSGQERSSNRKSFRKNFF